MSLDNIIETNPGVVNGIIDIQLYGIALVTNPTISQSDRIHSYRLVCNDLKKMYSITSQDRQFLYRMIRNR